MKTINLMQAARFGLVGLSSTGVYFLLLFLLQGKIGNLPLLTACCYVLSMIYNFLLQGWFTFGAGRPGKATAARFVAMHLGALAFNSAAMTALVEGLGVPLFPAQVATTGVIAVSTYLVSRHWVYPRAIE
ncbi:GtrA family protein [Paracoccus luteus]|uniref:GtrA family protein n=1 Tax=Paracoccus luteus TaxID=2508543 RepID=UPI00106FBA4C|nr:GtrA family protein [Paracoccus luteus]